MLFYKNILCSTSAQLFLCFLCLLRQLFDAALHEGKNTFQIACCDTLDLSRMELGPSPDTQSALFSLARFHEVKFDHHSCVKSFEILENFLFCLYVGVQ